MEKTYNELQITPQSEYSLFLDFILSLSDEAIEEANGTIILRSEEDLQMLLFGVETFAQELSKSLGKEIKLDTQLLVKENEDWIAQYRNSVQPLHVNDFYIHPSWVEGIAGKKNIIIDPALAFGSGHHETTYGCLMLLQNYVKEGNELLDVGCGSGILSIAARKCGAIVDLCDTDAQATDSATENFKLNQEQFNRIWTGSVQKRDKEYDIVVANIIADVLIMLTSDLQKAVKEGGLLILSGILDKYVDKVESKFSSMKLVEKYQKEEWFTLVLQRN
ncbi:50S ribosomal protein L11 methyltransferase [Sulfurospirillum multivorans]|uniref:Ribosomal protein L11 methyltransferase n=2 Tax=Sulfurospirillum multivorans TaxID=66821 RepID=A0AA86ANE5_SULMK|nr:50S ribosomal protein L11 methyltransferase [Sulfurospirillum multivorans]AHJ13704.1 ribosomal protein L11 methyltransferase [Sulfurospirillum multivorans DSM 12446]QEH07194.1 ribosomal protein L11 methyltransferase [Sulfurospirillum multivorans]